MDSSHGNTAWEIHFQWTWAFITLGHVWDPMLLQCASWSIHRNICCDPPSYFSASDEFGICFCSLNNTQFVAISVVNFGSLIRGSFGQYWWDSEKLIGHRFQVG